MTIVPNSDIILLKTPFEMDERNQLTFASKTAQYNYFHSLPKLEYDKCTYQRKDGVIRYTTEKNGLTYEDLIQYNYCMYQNEAYDNKWFYAYIENIEYKNDGMSEVKIKTDVFQTWQFDIKYKRSFVEREHVNNDTIGANIIEENLNLGDYTTCKDCEKILYDSDDFYVCMGVSELPDESLPDNVKIRNYNGIFGGLYYLAFTSFNNCEKAIKIYDHFGKADSINSIFMIPKNLGCVTDGTTATWSVKDFITTKVIYLEPSSVADTVGTLSCEIPSKLGKNYTPKNNKLFTFPFSFMNVTNNSGETIEFRYEDFEVDEITHKITATFWIDASLCAGMSMKAIPLFYKNINYNYNYGVTLGKLPVCSWSSDTYINWLTVNGVNNVISGVNSGYNLIGGMVTGSQGTATSGLNGIFSIMQERREAKIAPNQARGNVGNGDINFSEELDGGLTVYYMSIKDEIAKKIDNFFSMFGYKVNDVKIPNIIGRRNWNYVKTVDINITGDFPQADLQEIKDMFNAGCTFWHNPSTFLDYSQSNNIV